MSDEKKPTTTDAGIPATSDEFSLTVGEQGPDRPARPLRRAEDAALQPRARAGARGARQGRRRTRRLPGHPGRQPVHQGRPLPDRQGDRALPALLHGRRRAGLPGHGARPARVRDQVLHREGQLGHGRQQHAGLLRPRPLEVPGLHPLAEARAGHRPALARHPVGLLDHVARERAPGHDPDVRPRHPQELAPPARLLQPHLLVGQRGRREVLGQVPLPHRPGHREHPGVRGRRDRRHRQGLPPARPDQRDRQGRLPLVDAVRAGHAVRRGRGLPLQPVRPDQGLAQGRLPADRGRQDDAQPQPGELLRRGRAVHVQAGQPGAGHRPVARTRC